MRYPTRNGLPIHPYELGYTPTERIRGQTTNHHIPFERAQYSATKGHRIFRNLVDNVVCLVQVEHNDLHARYTAPPVPEFSLMVQVVQDYLDEHGVIDCVKEKKTNETYQVQADEWQYVKGLYRRVA